MQCVNCFCNLGWSEELVIDAWTNDRAGACEKAGITTEEETNGSNQLVSLGVNKVRVRVRVSE